jgi:hypothetical protein
MDKSTDNRPTKRKNRPIVGRKKPLTILRPPLYIDAIAGEKCQITMSTTRP